MTNICTDFSMRYQEDAFCQRRNETFFHVFVEMVWCFIWHDSPVQYDLQYRFSLQNYRPTIQDVPKKCMMSSLMLVVSDKSRVERNSDGFDRLCSEFVATRSARKQN